MSLSEREERCSLSVTPTQSPEAESEGDLNNTSQFWRIREARILSASLYLLELTKSLIKYFHVQQSVVMKKFNMDGSRKSCFCCRYFLFFLDLTYKEVIFPYLSSCWYQITLVSQKNYILDMISLGWVFRCKASEKLSSALFTFHYWVQWLPGMWRLWLQSLFELQFIWLETKFWRSKRFWV